MLRARKGGWEKLVEVTRARQAASCLPAALDAARAGPIVVGMDYGTHSTKVVLRPRSDAAGERGLMFFAERPTPERDRDGHFPPFAVPSLVRYSWSGRLNFGRNARELRDGQLFRSIKADLLPADADPYHRHNNYPPELTPDLLRAAFIACVL